MCVWVSDVLVGVGSCVLSAWFRILHLTTSHCYVHVWRGNSDVLWSWARGGYNQLTVKPTTTTDNGMSSSQLAMHFRYIICHRSSSCIYVCMSGSNRKMTWGAINSQLTYSTWQLLGRHWPWGQRSRGYQIHCRRGSAGRYDCWSF